MLWLKKQLKACNGTLGPSEGKNSKNSEFTKKGKFKYAEKLVYFFLKG